MIIYSGFYDVAINNKFVHAITERLRMRLLVKSEPLKDRNHYSGVTIMKPNTISLRSEICYFQHKATIAYVPRICHVNTSKKEAYIWQSYCSHW